MTRRTSDEYAIPKPGLTPRAQAWDIVLDHMGLIKKMVRRYSLELTSYGATTFAGLGPADLFDELIGAACEHALVAVEGWDEDRTSTQLSTHIWRVISRRLKRVAENLLKDRGQNTESLDALAEAEESDDFLDMLIELPSAETLYLATLPDEDMTPRHYVQLLMHADLTDAEHRLANIVMKGDEPIPFLSGTWRSLKDKLVKRATWLEAEGFGKPEGWERAIQHRIDEQARTWAHGSQS